MPWAWSTAGLYLTFSGSGKMKNSSSRSFPRVSVSFPPSQSHCAHDSTLGLPLGIPMTERLQAGFATKYIPLWTPAAIDSLASTYSHITPCK